MNALPLSARMLELLEVIDRLTAEQGFPPTLKECGAALGVHWTRAATLAKEAVSRGRLSHMPRSPRSWRVIPPAASNKPAGSARRRQLVP
jgi:hypothetical protein